MARIINTADLTETSHLDHNAKEWVYNGLDVCVTLEVRDALKPQLDNVSTATYEFSKSLQAPILEMTLRGVAIDEKRKREVLKLYSDQIDFLEKQLTHIVNEGVGFTDTPAPVFKAGKWTRWWRSRDKLMNLLYDVMGLPPVKKRSKSTGAYGRVIDRDALEKLRGYWIAEPIINHILLLRDIDKKRGFLETGVDPDGRMRCNFNIAGTNTGRLASSMSDFGTGTNLQNVDRELRSVFVADKGWKFANLDLEQGDARNVGAICWNLFVEKYGEEYAGSYLNACESGDLHTATCRMAWTNLDWTGDLRLDKAIAEQIAYRQDSYRQLSKKLGHATNYYVTPKTAASHTKLPQGMVEEFQIKYFNAYPVIGSFDHDPSLPNWHNYVRNELQTSHSLTTMFGRRRFFAGRAFEDETLREAIAYEPQSMTADEIDTGIIQIWRGNRVHLLVQVHDSILTQYREEEEDEVLPWLLETLKTRLILAKGREFVVPTEAKIGWNWGDVTYDKAGNVSGNPDGLIKWKGSDKRERTGEPWLKRSLLKSLL